MTQNPASSQTAQFAQSKAAAHHAAPVQAAGRIAYTAPHPFPVSRKVVQGVLTRSALANHVQYYRENGHFHESIDALDDVQKYMVASKVEDEGLELSETITNFLAVAGSSAEEDSDIDHGGGGADELTGEQLAQLKRGPGPSGPKSLDFASSAAEMDNVTYVRDGDGNIDFETPKEKNGNNDDGDIVTWSDPVPEPPVDLEEDGNKAGYGKMKSGRFVKIADASREQHFSIANRIAEENGQTAGEGGNSPDNYTWHHLLEEYKMVLVDRKVHQKFGHNGGFYFWT